MFDYENIFGPYSEGEKRIYFIEHFRVNMQFALQKALNDNKVTRNELAKRLEKTRTYVDHTYFRYSANPSLIMLAKAFAAIEQEIEFKLVEKEKK